MSGSVRQEKTPGFGESLAVLLICVFILVGGILIFKLDTAIVILFSTIIFTLFGALKGIPYKAMHKSMMDAMASASGVLLMLTMVGALVGAMMAAGTIPYIIDLGLRSIRPVIFLPLAVFFSTLISTCTGSAISVMFTVGVAFMGIAEGMGVPGAMTAGAVLCGAYFGDKNSPVSAFAAFASAVSNADHSKNLKNMLYTTLPATLGSMVILFFIGLKYARVDMSSDLVMSIRGGLNDAFRLSPVCLIPLVVMLLLILLKLPSVPSIALGAVTAAVVSVLYQGLSIHDAMQIMINGYRTESTMEFVITMANRGGMLSMAPTVICIMLAVCMGGVIGRIRIMDVIMGRFDRFVSNRKSLVLSTVFLGIAAHYATAQVMPASILLANVFGKKYDEQGLDRSMMSRAIADGTLLSCPIVPWDPDGICTKQAFGVSAAAFAPFYLVIWLSLIMEAVSVFTGFGLVEAEQKKEE